MGVLIGFKMKIDTRSGLFFQVILENEEHEYHSLMMADTYELWRVFLPLTFFFCSLSFALIPQKAVQ